VRKKLTRLDLERMKSSGEPVAWITAYDFITARLAEQAGLDMLLVGDSLGMAVYGYAGTVPVTMAQCLLHSEAVRRGAPNTFVIGDMPFGAYHSGIDEACRNAVRFFKEAGVDCIKLEGGRRVAPVIEAIVNGGMLVMGHIGLTPQSSAALGGFKAQGTTAASARAIIDDAHAVVAAGAFALVLEAVPTEVTRIVCDAVPVPVYGIGAGACDGQVMVSSDLLGLFQAFTPKFVKRYAQIGADMKAAFEAFAEDVRGGRFPGPEHGYAMKPGEVRELTGLRPLGRQSKDGKE
jgi:3-methyl-2-oxobutanoate hydroxymethyltransferase